MLPRRLRHSALLVNSRIDFFDPIDIPRMIPGE
jgi:hypothetical protein